MASIEPFPEPIYVTRPILPDLQAFYLKLNAIWAAKQLTNNGPQLKILEEKLLQKLKVPNLSLLNNGTTALMLACKSLELAGEVITTPFTFAATPHVLTWNNLTPVFCDIDPISLNIDPKKIEACITPQTRAILGVHVFGTPCDVFKIQNIADRHGLRVIYDAAHAFGVEINGKGIGTFGDISMFSFHATKLFHTAEGGALAYNDHNLKQYINLLRNFGIKNEEEVILPGINGKMNEIQAALGLVILDGIDREMSKRKDIADKYQQCFTGTDGINCMMLNDVSIKPNYQNFVIRIDQQRFGMSRDDVYDELKKYNIYTRKYFYPLCSNYGNYTELPSSKAGNLPIANKIAGEVLSLPFYGDLSLDSVEKICLILTGMKK